MSEQSQASSLNMANPGLVVDKCHRFIDNRNHERKFVQNGHE